MPIPGAVLTIDIAIIVGVALPGHRVCAGPLPVRLRSDVERHADTVAGVVPGAAHLGHVPARAEIARAPLAAGLEAATGQHYRIRSDLLFDAVNDRANSFNAILSANERHRARIVDYVYSSRCRSLVFRFDQAGATTVGIDHDAAKELESALVVVSLPSVVRQEFYALPHQPMNSIGTAFDQCLGEIRIYVVLRDAAKIVEIVFRGILTEIGARDVGVAQIRNDAFDVLRTVMHHPETAAGEFGIAAAFFL